MQLKIFFVFVIFSFCLIWSSFGQSSDKYDNPDVTDIYSTHPDRPFRYGYNYDYKEILEAYTDHYTAFGIQPENVVAEVGAASGWLEGVFSIFSDSVTYYIQDIDSVLLNETQFNAVVKHFSGERPTPQTNHFKYVLGTTTGTNLPDNTFDLIIINNTFHEFTEPNPMVQDIVKKLKKDGRLIIWDSYDNDYLKVIHDGCEIKAYDVKTMKDILSRSGLYLTQMAYPESATINYLTFEQNKEKADAYEEELIEIEPILTELATINSVKVLKDWRKLSLIQDMLMEEIETILEFFPDFKTYFFSLSSELDEIKKYRPALTVLETCLQLFPEDIDCKYAMADAYLDYGMYEDALGYYSDIAYQDSTDEYAWNGIILSLTEMGDYYTAMFEYEEAIGIDSTFEFVYYDIGNMCARIIGDKNYKNNDLGGVVGEEGLFKSHEDILKFAIKSFSKAIDYNSLEPMYYLSRAGIYMESGDYKKALSDYDRVLYLNPNVLEYYKLRANCKKQMGDEAGYNEDLALMKSVKKTFRKKAKSK